MNISIYKQINMVSLCIFSLFISSIYPRETSKTRLYDINGNKYISALEYADSQNIRTIFYDDKEKLEFRFQNYKLLISSYSSFIRINDDIYHMYLPVVYDGNDFFIPIDPFLEIINNIGMPNSFIDSSEKYVLTTLPQFNIQGTSVINKVNGTVIIIKTRKLFRNDGLPRSVRQR